MIDDDERKTERAIDIFHSLAHGQVCVLADLIESRAIYCTRGTYYNVT